ncbi:MAG: hypothetical protein MUF48_20855 [Pirellulaceae bacterium]|nr:hypothetical protein [Pirellulaceae bacterium]
MVRSRCPDRGEPEEQGHPRWAPEGTGFYTTTDTRPTANAHVGGSLDW